MNLRSFMEGATQREAQLALSYMVWPEQAPDPRVVDAWLRQAVLPGVPQEREAPNTPEPPGSTRQVQG